MALALADVLAMVSASLSLGLFTDKDDNDFVELVDALDGIDVKSCEDFRFSFVTDNEADLDAVVCFCKGALLSLPRASDLPCY